MMSEREDERASPPPKGADCSSAGESPGRVRCLRGGLMSDTDWVDPLARLRVVLIATSHPGNIGAAARALHTMGLSRLILVRPGHFPSDEATAMAAGGAKLLASASIVGSLAEALRGTVGSIAFTARARRGNDRLLPLAEVRADIIAQAQRGEVALVFGNEQAGLSNEVARMATPTLVRRTRYCRKSCTSSDAATMIRKMFEKVILPSGAA